MRLTAVRNSLLCLSLAALFSGVSGASDFPAPPAPPRYPSAYANPTIADRGAVAVRQSLRKLKTRASLIMVVAHPDDEDGGMLAYESRDVGADTSLLTLNRGEGGQNDMSDNYWDELGLVRTQELLAADQYYGVHQYWTRVADYGFSKTLEEALKVWGHDRVLYDVVRVVRMTRPLVVTSVFVGGVSDGHGHHQTAGVMAQEVYKAAADPNVFPDQIKAGLRPWTPLKVYARVPRARITDKGIYDYATDHWAPVRFRNYVDNTSIDGLPSTTVEIPDGRYSPYYGLSYSQLSRIGLGEQKSQNGGVGMPPAGPGESPYHLYASRVSSAAPGAKESDLFEGIDVSLEGIASYAPSDQQGEWKTRLAALSATVDKASDSFSPEDPSKIAPLLADGLTQTNALLADIAKSSLPEDARYDMTHELLIKQQQFNDALAQALALSVVATVAPAGADRVGPLGDPSAPEQSFPIAVPGQSFKVNVHVANQGGEAVTVGGFDLDTNEDPGWKITAPDVSGVLGPAKVRNVAVAVVAPPHPTYTRPYFSRPSVEQPYYNIDDPRYLNLPTSYYPLSAKLTFQYHGVDFYTTAVVQSIHRVAGPGPMLEPLLVGPPISLWLSPQAGIVPLSSAALHLQVTLHSDVDGPAKGTLHLELPKGWTSIPASADFSTAQNGDEQNITFEVHPAGVRAQQYSIKAVAEYDGQNYIEGFKTVGYTGLRPYPYYRDANYHTTGVDVKVAGAQNVGYIMGTGDDVPRSLEDLGVHVKFLSPQDIQTGNLSAYDAIIVGIRAYDVRPEIRTANGRLLDYVKNGGALLVQYQTPEFDHNYGPYPFSFGPNPEKVVEEDDKVTLASNDPVLSWPNKITEADFSGWVEERGHDFVAQWDPKYITPTEMHDQDQDPQKGGLIYARYGTGVYVYTAFALYRQLPEGVPGGYRLFANLLSLKKNPGLAPGK
jgi:LmbE family N-acetylglucosaminyl deacetylase